MQVLILYRHELFGRGIARLLGQHGLDAVAIDANSKDAIYQVRAMQPAVLLMEDRDADTSLVKRLTEVLELGPDMNIICVNTQDNRLNIHVSKQMMAREPEDLFNAIDILTRCRFEGAAPQQQALTQ